MSAKRGTAVLLVVAPAMLGLADVIVIAPAAVDNSFSNFPFLICQGGPSSMRYQQVYDASAFSVINPIGGYIRLIELVPGGSDGGIALSGSIQINFSTTSKAPDNLSPVFSENVGPDDLAVFGPGPLSVSASPGGMAQITFAGHFFYNPALGNLLMDVRVEGVPPIMRDESWVAHNESGDVVSRVYAQSITALTATVVDTTGLVTWFQIYPMPRLHAEELTNSIVISWPDDYGLFDLQSAGQVEAGAQWQIVTNQPIHTFATNSVALPVDLALQARYFRLRSKPSQATSPASALSAHAIRAGETKPE